MSRSIPQLDWSCLALIEGGAKTIIGLDGFGYDFYKWAQLAQPNKWARSGLDRVKKIQPDEARFEPAH